MKRVYNHVTRGNNLRYRAWSLPGTKLDAPYFYLSFYEYMLGVRHGTEQQTQNSKHRTANTTSDLVFLLYINDLGENCTSRMRLFADDTLIYSTIESYNDAVKLTTATSSTQRPQIYRGSDKILHTVTKTNEEREHRLPTLQKAT